MLGMLLPELLKRTGVAPDEVDDFIVGCARGIDEQWTYGGRNPLFLANLSEKTAAKAVDQVRRYAEILAAGYYVAIPDKNISIRALIETATALDEHLNGRWAMSVLPEQRYRGVTVTAGEFLGKHEQILVERPDQRLSEARVG